VKRTLGKNNKKHKTLKGFHCPVSITFILYSKAKEAVII